MKKVTDSIIAQVKLDLNARTLTRKQIADKYSIGERTVYRIASEGNWLFPATSNGFDTARVQLAKDGYLMAGEWCAKLDSLNHADSFHIDLIAARVAENHQDKMVHITHPETGNVWGVFDIHLLRLALVGTAYESTQEAV
ncbi:hypothetical protein RCJ22_15590 [Vibrio sp. FNV 38]|nr:hypothetical protein [Vibrio sp. FNV 38]